MSRLLLVRHCESSGQHADAPLTERGLAQAEALAATLAAFPIERVISSPYLRARQTIAPFAARAGLAVKIDARLAERRLSAEPIAHWRELVRASFVDLDERAHGLTAFAGHGQHLSLILHSIDGRFGYEGWESLSNPDLYLVEPDGHGGLRYARAWGGPS